MAKPKTGSLIKEVRRYRVPRSKTTEAIHYYLQGINTPRSLAVWLLYKNDEHTQLLDLECNPDWYLEGGTFRDDYAATRFLSKAEFLNTGIDTAQVAFAKFRDCEEQNRRTNTRFKNLASDPQFTGPNVWLLNAVTRKIANILGEFSPVEWFEQCSWGPGSTFCISGRDTSSVNKFQNESGITRDLHHLIGGLIPVAFPLWGESLKDRGYTFVEGDKIITVPKNAKTDRVIGVGPGLNVFFQLGIGKMIGRRLQRMEGIDLHSQDRNGLLAFYGSMSGKLATEDFTSASDLIATEVIREVLPPDWFTVLNSARSTLYRDGKQWIRAEKFSSMGNGFTFPLQSLLFTAAAVSVCDYLHIGSEYVGVFGDDVILPTEAHDLFLEFCSFLGFTINASKSFASGYFRESCGTHYFRGLDVKPFYLKKVLTNIQSVYICANSIRRQSHRWNFGSSCDRRLRKTVAYLTGLTPKKFRFRIPDGFGDGGFISNFDEATPKLHYQYNDRGLEGLYFRCLTDVGVRNYSEGLGILLDRLFSTSSDRAFANKELEWDPIRLRDLDSFLDAIVDWQPTRSYGNEYALRAVTRTKVIRVLAPRWYNLGPWI